MESLSLRVVNGRDIRKQIASATLLGSSPKHFYRSSTKKCARRSKTWRVIRPPVSKKLAVLCAKRMSIGRECMGHCAGFARNKWKVLSGSQVTIEDSAQTAMVGRSQGAKPGKPYSGVCCSLIGLHTRVLAGGNPQWMTRVSHILHSNIIQAVYPATVVHQGDCSNVCDKVLLGPWR